MKVVFNKVTVESLPEGTHYDTKVPGLVLNVTKNSRRFGIYKWAGNGPVRKSIGPWPAWTVELARVEARKLIHALDRGDQPEKRSGPKLSKIIDNYEQALKSTGAKHPDHYSVVMLRCCPDWFNRAADSITRQMVEDHHAKIAAERGPHSAAQWVKAFRAIYRHADIDCPAARTRIKAPMPRARVASHSEMAAIKTELAKTDPYWRDYFMLSILTGARRDNVASMRFEDVADGSWSIPATESKTHEAIRLPLVPEAIEIIEARRRTLGTGYVFPSDGDLGRLSSTWERWDAIRKAAGCPDLTQHDLRRTMISRLAENGVNPAVAAKAAGHRSVVTTLKTYTVVRQDQVLDALKGIK